MATRPFLCRLDSRKMTQEVVRKAIPVLDPRSFRLKDVDSWSIGGEAPKDFLVMGGGNPREENCVAYIAKESRVCGDRECVTEELISCVGRMLPLRVARSLLVRIPDPRTGQESVRFMSRYFLGPTEELIHGVELLAIWLDVEQSEMESVFLAGKRGERRTKERDFYSIEFIYDVLHDLCKEGEFECVKDSFGRMIAYDALIGAMDRHAMNWGIIRDLAGNKRFVFSPIFDTARGLFWHHNDSYLLRFQENGNRKILIEKYARKSEPLIGCRRHPHGNKLNHFETIEYIMNRMNKEFGRSVTQIVKAFDPVETRKMLYVKFGRIISELRIEYISDLLRFRHNRLREICGLKKWHSSPAGRKT